ncbi:MAG: hypothetical protein N2442_04490 [Spirochaetes bacterium]|nr:hypothetical protein [Spirochaetota bacterium]
MRSFFFFLFVCLGAPILIGEELRVDTEELQGALKEGIVFENYEGVPEKIETLAQIRGIGTALAGEGRRASTGKYTVIRAVDPSTPIGLDADIFILEPDASVDHIRNLRWILGSYLEAQYGYGRADADLLSQFITLYNAVYRKNIPYFKERYKPVVLSYLDPAKVGLALRYREWPGNTQLLIPLSGPKKKGILSIETGTLTEKPVVEELRKEEDRGIPLRKEMVELKERQLKEEERQLEVEKKALQVEKEKLKAEENLDTSQRKQVSQPSRAEPSLKDIPSSHPQPSAATQPVRSSEQGPKTLAPSSTPTSTTSPSVPAVEPTPSSTLETKSSQPSIAAKEEELKEKEKQIQEKQQALREERIAIAKDQQELLAGNALQVAKMVPFLFMEKEGPRLVLLEENSGVVTVRSNEYPLKQPIFHSFGGGYLVILDRGGKGGKLAILDPASLQVRVTSREEIYGPGKVRVHESVCFAVLREGNAWFVGKFDSTLALLARSRVSVVPETDLAIQGGKLYVQTSDGKVAVLSLELTSP